MVKNDLRQFHILCLLSSSVSLILPFLFVEDIMDGIHRWFIEQNALSYIHIRFTFEMEYMRDLRFFGNVFQF